MLDPDSARVPPPPFLLDNLPGQERHPWVPNDGGFALNTSYVQGSWTNSSNGSTTVVTCLLALASENPYWQQENMRTTEGSGGVSCNQQMYSVYGEVRAINYGSPINPDQQTQLGSTATFSSLALGSDGFYDGRATTTFTRGSDSTTQQIKLNLRLELGTAAGRSNVGWNSYPNCTRPSQRVIDCEFWSPPYQHVPYPCPNGKHGAQPGTCSRALNDETQSVIRESDSLSPNAGPLADIQGVGAPGDDAGGEVPVPEEDGALAKDASRRMGARSTNDDPFYYCTNGGKNLVSRRWCWTPHAVTVNFNKAFRTGGAIIDICEGIYSTSRGYYFSYRCDVAYEVSGDWDDAGPGECGDGPGIGGYNIYCKVHAGVHHRNSKRRNVRGFLKW